MNPGHLLNREAELTHVVQDGAGDEYNDPTTSESTSTVLLEVQQTDSREVTVAGEIVTSDHDVFFHLDTVVGSLDRFTLADSPTVTFHIVGAVHRWRNPRTRQFEYQQARARVVT